MNRPLTAYAVITLGMLPQGQTVADSASIESIVRQNTFEISVKDGELTGRGADLLRTEANAAKFIMLGEPHNSNDVPRFTSALFRTLHRDGAYQALALEQGPTVIALLAAAEETGGLTKLIEVARRNAAALQFRTEEELTMMAEIVGESSAGREAIWGIDRELAATQVLDQLARMMESSAAASAAELLDRVNEHNSGHLYADRFMIMHTSDVEAFGLRWRDASEPVGPLADLLYRSAHNIALFEKGDEESRRVATFDREQLLKDQFAARYRDFSADRRLTPKIMVKMGHQHCTKRIDAFGFESLGAYLESWAGRTGAHGLFVNIQILNPPGKYWSLTDYPDYKVLTDAGSMSEWRLIDLRPLRSELASNAIDLNATLSELIQNFDCLLLLGGASPGSMSWMRP